MGILNRIENLGDISSLLQSYALEYLGVVLELVGMRDFEWIWVNTLSLVDSVHGNDGKLGNRHLELLDDIIDELKIQRNKLRNQNQEQKVDEVLAYLAAAKSASEDGNYSLVKENAERVLEPLFDVSCDNYRDNFLIVPILLQLEYAFLRPWEFEEEDNHEDHDNWREWELRSLHEKYLPRLQEMAADDDDRPDILKIPEIREPLNQAIQKLSWVAAEAHGGNMEMSLLQPRIRNACRLLREAGLVEAKVIIEIYIPIFDDFWRGVIRNVRNPGSEKLPEFFRPVTEAILSYFAWPFFLLSSLDYKADLILKLLETIDDFLRESPEPLKSLEDLCELIQDYEERGIEAWAKLLGIWDFLSEKTCLKAKFDSLKEIWQTSWDYYHGWTINLDVDQGGVQVQTAVLRDIRDVLLSMKADQDAQQIEVQQVLEQHKLAAQNYLSQNEHLFEPPAVEIFEPLPFKELPDGTIRRVHDTGVITFILPDGTIVKATPDKKFAAMLPHMNISTELTIETDGKLHLDDGRSLEVVPELISEPALDEQIMGLPEHSILKNKANCRVAEMPDGTSLAYFTRDNLVKVVLNDGSECLIAFTKVQGLGTDGTMTRISDNLRSFKFDNGIAGTVELNEKYEIVLPNGSVVQIKWPEIAAADTSNNFTCDKDA